MADQSLAFVAEAEPMLVYRLEDGTTLRIKVCLMRVSFKGMDVNTKLPLYELKWQQVCDVEPGQHLVDTPTKGKTS